VQGRADLVGTTSLGGVALSTSGLEELGSLLDVAWRGKSKLVEGFPYCVFADCGWAGASLEAEMVKRTQGDGTTMRQKRRRW